MSEMPNPPCDEVREMLPSLLDGAEPPLALRRHVSRCAGCARELEAYSSLRAATSQLATAVAAPPPGLQDALVAIPRQASRLDEVRSHVVRHRTAYAGGAALALGAAGAALWRSRRRGLVTA